MISKQAGIYLLYGKTPIHDFTVQAKNSHFVKLNMYKAIHYTRYNNKSTKNTKGWEMPSLIYYYSVIPSLY